MIEPQKAMFLYNPGQGEKRGFMVVGDSDRRGKGLYSNWKCSMGACFSHWRDMSDEEIYQCMHWPALEIAEFAGVSIRNIRDMFSENVRGYREYDSKVGKMAIGPAASIFQQ